MGSRTYPSAKEVLCHRDRDFAALGHSRGDGVPLRSLLTNKRARKNLMTETDRDYSPPAPAISPAPRMIAGAREPPGATLGGSHLQPAIGLRVQGRVRRSSASRSSSKVAAR
jgi:hypothetical protein